MRWCWAWRLNAASATPSTRTTTTVGWHITGTAGVFGAAVAAGKLLGLTEQQMVWALGIAASQPVGFRESFGSMTKSFNPGRAANNGMTPRCWPRRTTPAPTR